MANNLFDMKDTGDTEVVGKAVIALFKTIPYWSPFALYGWYRFHPSSFIKFFGPFYPYIKTGVVWLSILALITAAIMTIRFITNRQFERKRYKYYRIVPHESQTIRQEAILEMVEMIAGYKRSKRMRYLKGREWFQWLIHRDKEGIKFFVGFPSDRKAGILRTIQNAYPECELHPAEDVRFPSKSAYTRKAVMDYKGIHEVKPLKSFQGKNGIGNLISYMEPGTWIDFTFSPSSPFKLMKKIKKSQEKMKKFHRKMSDMDSFEKADLRSVSKRLSGRDKVFTVSVSICGETGKGSLAVHSIATTLSSVLNDENGLSFRRSYRPSKPCPYPITHKMDWIGRELANVLLMPSPSHDIFAHVPHLKQGERALEPKEMNDGIAVGYMKHPVIQKRLVKIPYNVFKEHWFMSGKTGSGKSSLILMVLQSMIDDWAKNPKKAPGFTLFDPAKETALTVISRLKKLEAEGVNIPWEKINYISLTKDEFPLSLNLLHKSEGELTDTVKNNIMDILDTAFNNEGAPKMKRWIENAILALLEDDRPHSILGVNRMFNDENFRERVVNKIKDPLLKQEWMNYNFKDTDVTLDSIRTRMAPFQSSIYMRRMFGQTNFSLNLRKWMDEGHLVLVDMKDVSDSNIALTVGHMVTQYHQTAIKRQSGSKLHMLLVDEAHLAPIPIMKTIIAFDRKFGLGLGIVTQFMDQLPQWLKQAIKGNMGTILSGTQGDESAAQVEKMTNGRFTADYVQGLSSNTVAVFTKEKVGDENKITTCTTKTEPPYVYKEDGTPANYTDQSEMTATFAWLENIGLELQKRDGQNCKVVDEQISNYLGIADMDDIDEQGPGLFYDLEGPDLKRGDAMQQDQLFEEDDLPFRGLPSQIAPPEEGVLDIMDKDEAVHEKGSSDAQTNEPENKNKEEGADESVNSFF